jgi:hypothetical protein
LCICYKDGAKHGLDEKEIAFIEEKIKPME